MPYSKKQLDNGKWQVSSPTDVKGTHDTEADADSQLAALNINAPDSAEKAEGANAWPTSISGVGTGEESNDAPSRPSSAPSENIPSKSVPESTSPAPSVPTATGTNARPMSKDLDGTTFNAFIPMQKIDLDRQEVWGWGTMEQTDQADEILDWASSKPYLADWTQNAEKRSGGKSKGPVRSMHQAIAAGKLIECKLDDASKGMYVGAKIVDANEWRKVVEGVYTGFSIGGQYVRRWPDSQPGIIRYTAKPAELSIVDAPCVPGATFQVVKAAGVTNATLLGGTGKRMIKVYDSRDFDENIEKALPGLAITTPAPVPGTPPVAPVDDGPKTVTMTIKCSPEVCERFVRFLSMCNRAGRVGHSGRFAFDLDGDGGETLDVDGVDLPDIGEDEIMRGDGYDYLKPYGKMEETDLQKAKPITSIEAPESIGTINAATDGKKAIEIERLPQPAVPLVLEGGKVPDQDTLMAHAISKVDLENEMDNLIDLIPQMIKFTMQEYLDETISKTVNEAVKKALTVEPGNETALNKTTPLAGHVISVKR